MSLFSTVEGFTFPDVISDEILLQEAICALPLELIQLIMKYDPTLFDTFKKMLYPYKTDPSFLNRRLMQNMYGGLNDVMCGILIHRPFTPYLDETDDYIISHYQFAMGAVWYIYHKIDPSRKKNHVKNVVIQHLTVILHEVLLNGNLTYLYLDEEFKNRLCCQFVWYHLQYYVTLLIDGTADEDLSYPLCDILDSLCIQINFTDTKEAFRHLRYFYRTNRPCCDDC